MRTALLTFLLVALSACSKDNAVAVNQTECGDNSIECVPCSPDELRCDGKTLRRCQADGMGFDALMVCASEALCVKGMDAGACLAQVCSAGESRCEGKVMKVCSASQDGFDSKECTSEGSCQQGLAAGVCATVGGCVTASDCGGADTECSKKACDDGKCTMAPSPQGTVLAAQTQGDCRKTVCDGKGSVTFEADTSDSPDDGNECTLESCNGASPQTSFAAAGTACSGSGKCDGAGKCSKCTPGELGPCADATTARQCDTNGGWVDIPCTGLKDRCDHGKCVGGATVTWVPAPGGGTYGIDSAEVTRAQYAAWLATSPQIAAQKPACLFNATFVPSTTCTGTNNLCNGTPCAGHPQICVDWCDAYAYCQAVGKRLCGAIGGGSLPYDAVTDASTSQWHRACTSGGTQSFPYGDGHENGKCNNYDNSSTGCSGDGFCSTIVGGYYPECQSTVAEYKGVYDLSGNVWEWEDACNAELGKDDYCRIRGSAYDTSFDEQMGPWPECKQLSFGFRSTAGKKDIGFRCCVD